MSKHLENLKNFVFKGIDFIESELGPDLKRLSIQGSMELASALFNGNGFVPYGPGQYTPTNSEQGKATPEVEHARSEQAREIGGREA